MVLLFFLMQFQNCGNARVLANSVFFTEFAFQIVVTSILIFSAVIVMAVRVAADLNLHKAARQVKL